MPQHTLRDQLQTALGDAYVLEHELGHGGMATVYLARDLKHERRVALKVLDADIGTAVGAERFLAEIRVTARLQHPNVLPLFDSGSVNGVPYYTMPFVAGESLRARLEREGPMLVSDALRIVSAVAAALEHAHRHGVVHRDIKPENILLSDGVPVVADFGIAKAVAESRRAAGGTSAGLTQLGTSLGTPAYMSPEQAMGEAEIDARTDVYALGVLLYELLSGELPFTGPTTHSVIAKHLMTPAPSVRGARSEVSPVIDAAIQRAMAKDPAARFQSAAALAEALVMVPAVEPKPDYSLLTEPVTRTEEPLIGRRKELGDLLGRLDAMEQGKGGFVLVGGEPGVGKTRLVEAVLLEARRRGHFVAVGHCYEMEGAPPYLPFLEQMEYTSRVVPPGRFRAVLGDSAAELSRILPGLRQLFRDIPPPLELPPDQQRHFLFQKYREYSERANANVPVVLMFDDLHWADESTLLLVEFLANGLGRRRALVVGTYRDTDLDVGRPFARSLERLSRQRLADRLVLRRMPESDVAELLASLGAPEPPPAVVRAIYHETEGNPFFVEEVFQHLRDEGRLLDADGHWLPDILIEELEVPEGVRLVIGRRLERVTDTCRAVLTAAAVIGPRFDLRLLEALGETDSDAILDALDQAAGAGLVLAQQVGRDTRYSFAHELIRQTLLGALSMPRRQRRHRQTADAIEVAHAGKLDAHAAALAYHLFMAGAAVDEERTTRWLLNVGQQALAVGAFDEALGQADKALSILEQDGNARHAELLLLRGHALRGLGRWSDAMAALENARNQFEHLGMGEGVVTATLALSSLVVWSVGGYARMTELLTQTLATVHDMPVATRARLLAMAGSSSAVTHGYDDAMEMIEEAVRLVSSTEDDIARAEVLGLRGMARTYHGEYTAAGNDFSTAFDTFSRAGRRWECARFGQQLVHARHYTGRIDESLALAETVAQHAKDTGHLGALAATRMVALDTGWLRTGDVGALAHGAGQATLEWSSAGALFTEAAKWRVATARLEMDDVTAAEGLEGSAERTGVIAFMDRFWAEHFRVLAYTRPEHAPQVFAQYAHRMPVAGRRALSGAVGALGPVVDGLATLGDRVTAAAYYPQVLQHSDAGLVQNGTDVTQCVAGIAAACGGMWEAAERHFELAMQQSKEMRFVVSELDGQRWHAWMLLSRRAPGDVERARELLSTALQRAHALGIPRRIRLYGQMLRDSEV